MCDDLTDLGLSGGLIAAHGTTRWQVTSQKKNNSSNGYLNKIFFEGMILTNHQPRNNLGIHQLTGYKMGKWEIIATANHQNLRSYLPFCVLCKKIGRVLPESHNVLKQEAENVTFL